MKSSKITKILFIMVALIGTIFTIVSMFSGIFDSGAMSLATIGFAFSGIADTEFDTFEPNDGDENMGGFGQLAYLALRSHVSSYPAIPQPDDPTTLEELVALTGDFGFNTGKHFIPIFVAPGSLFASPESQGEYPGAKSFAIKGGFTIPGMKGKQRAMARIFNNSYGYLVVPQEDGTRMCYGTELHPLHFTPKGDSGKKAADSKRFDVEFATDSFVPGYTYNGVIVLDGSTLPAVS
jgi:hypothetical protein